MIILKKDYYSLLFQSYQIFYQLNNIFWQYFNFLNRKLIYQAKNNIDFIYKLLFISFNFIILANNYYYKRFKVYYL